MFTVYVIRCADTKKIYIGQTNNLQRRLEEHNKIHFAKRSSFTFKNGTNWKLIYKESFLTREEALKRENELKSHRGREFIKNMVAVAQR